MRLSCLADDYSLSSQTHRLKVPLNTYKNALAVYHPLEVAALHLISAPVLLTSIMIVNTFVLLSLVASTIAEPQRGIGALIGKIAGKTDPKVRPQDPPQLPPKFNGGKQDPPPPPANPGLAEAKAQVNNVAGLNRKWEQAETIADVADLGSSIAEAILGSAQTTTAVGTRSHSGRRLGSC